MKIWFDHSPFLEKLWSVGLAFCLKSPPGFFWLRATHSSGPAFPVSLLVLWLSWCFACDFCPQLGRFPSSVSEYPPLPSLVIIYFSLFSLAFT